MQPNKISVCLDFFVKNQQFIVCARLYFTSVFMLIRNVEYIKPTELLLLLAGCEDHNY